MKSSGLSSSPFFFFFLISKALNAYRLIKASTRPQLFIFFFFFFCRHTSAAARWKTSSGKRGYESYDRGVLFEHFTLQKFSTVTYQPIIFADDVVKWRERGTPYWFQKVIKDKRRWLQEIAAKNRLLSLRRDEISSNFREKKPVFHMSAPRWTRNVKVFIRLIYFHGFSGAFFNLYSTAESRKMTGNVATGRWKMMTWLLGSSW